VSNPFIAGRAWWALARRDDRWIVIAVESDTEGRHHLGGNIIAAPSYDPGVQDETVIAIAQSDAVRGHRIGELTNVEMDSEARAAALDLALVDDRFSPVVLETAARQAVAAWAEAIEGSDATLSALADQAVIGHLLHPGDPSRRTRLVVRSPNVQGLRIKTVSPRADPPRMTIEIDVIGRRYTQARDTGAVVAGSVRRDTTFTERWTLTLDGPPEHPWRITGV
jgi:hypothetical protein